MKFQQGDVIIRRIETLEKEKKDWNGKTTNLSDTNERWIQKDRVVIAEGEVTGHAHAFNNDLNKDVKISLYKNPRLSRENWTNSNGATPAYMEIQSIAADLDKKVVATLTHEEHNPIELPPGIYRINQIQEFDYLTSETRVVVD
tara:strand:+ start:229 stop:660 length:432 start_codon:yes stop_codon:yes gene_type:complete